MYPPHTHLRYTVSLDYFWNFLSIKNCSGSCERILIVATREKRIGAIRVARNFRLCIFAKVSAKIICALRKDSLQILENFRKILRK